MAVVLRADGPGVLDQQLDVVGHLRHRHCGPREVADDDEGVVCGVLQEEGSQHTSQTEVAGVWPPQHCPQVASPTWRAVPDVSWKALPKEDSSSGALPVLGWLWMVSQIVLVCSTNCPM